MSAPSTPATAPKPASEVETREELRHELEQAWENGWEIAQETDDRAFLIYRSYGRIWIHIVLLIFTAGIGNLAYFWYRYFHKAQRHVIRVRDPSNNG